MPSTEAAAYEAIRWEGGTDGTLVLLDQTRLPIESHYLRCRTVEQVYDAIRSLAVRGAPAIGIAAAYGALLGLQGKQAATRDQQYHALHAAVDRLAASRPTAVNLFWALERIRAKAQGWLGSVAEVGPSLAEVLLQEAQSIHAEDRAMCHAIGACGAELIPNNACLMTHCNTGGLATSEYGTALGIFFTAQDQGKSLRIFVDETRPLLQGARLTCWELRQRQIPHTLICDSMAAMVMASRKIDGVFVGADRIALNGDTANKIGTYGLAVVARAHDVPFYVAAPSSTFDLSLRDGSQIPIEERKGEEITEGFGNRTAPAEVVTYNPAFDVTPARLITAIVTEKGIIQPVTADAIRKILGVEERLPSHPSASSV